MSVDMYNMLCDSDLYTLKCCLLDHDLEVSKELTTVFTLNKSLYVHFIIHIQQTYSQTQYIKMIETGSLIETSWERGGPHDKNRFYGRLQHTNTGMEKDKAVDATLYVTEPQV